VDFSGIAALRMILDPIAMISNNTQLAALDLAGLTVEQA
jgi:hypothetical protein